jgi:two-component system LytT family response regulator
MGMITAIIIDDEARGRLALSQKLKDYCPEVRLEGEAEDGEQGIRLIAEHQPDLVFLDIEMPRMNGFEMLSKMPQKNFHVVFTTAYDQYAIKAIRFSAFDYLLKPVDIEELKTVITKVKSSAKEAVEQRLEILTQHLRSAISKLAISTMDGILFFDLQTIVHIEALSNYTVFSFVDRPRLTVSKTLKEFEDLLPADRFFRPHHSHIVNLRYVKRYTRGDGGQIELQNGEIVDVSRKKKEEFLRIMGI